MLLVGDKFKQVKELCGFNFKGETFIVEDLVDSHIVFSLPNRGVGMMTLEEFSKYFEKIVEPKWSDWERYGFDLEYRLKGELLEVRVRGSETSVFAKPCEEDEFNLDIGIAVCIQKLRIKEIQHFIKEVKKDSNSLIARAQADIAKINRSIKESF